MGFSRINHPDGLNNTLLSQGRVLENGFHCGMGGQSFPSKDGEVVRSLSDCSGLNLGSISGYILLVIFSSTPKEKNTHTHI